MSESICTHLSTLFTNFSTIYTNILFPPILITTLFFFTLYLRVPQFLHGREALRIFFGKQQNSTSKGTSLFQTLATSLAGSIGMGSVTGVSLALVYGGPGVIFWMWVLAILGMSIRLAEVSLSHHTRIPAPKGQEGYVGGPMYYIHQTIGSHLLAKLYAFAILVAAFITSNFTQSNSVAQLLEGGAEAGQTHFSTWFNLPTYITGVIFAFFVALVILGGLKRIAKLAELMIPIMGMVYFVLVCIILTYNYKHILPACRMIIFQAFNPTAILGMSMGAAFWVTFSQGMRFGFFATEVANGTAGIVHSTSKETNSLRVGRISMLEPVITACFVCTLTALAVLSSGEGKQWKQTYMQQASKLSIRVLSLDNKPYTGSFHVDEGTVKAKDLQIIAHNTLIDKFQLNISNQQGERQQVGTFSLQVVKGKITFSSLPKATLYAKAPLMGATLARATFRLGDNHPFINLLCMLLLLLCLLLFAFSTIISWGYYGEQALRFLGWGGYTLLYRIVYIFAVVLSSTLQAGFVWTLASLVVVSASLPNILALFLARKKIKEIVQQSTN